MILDYIEYAKQVVLDRQYLSLFTATIVLFSASFIAWFIYSKQLAKRDLFEVPKVKAERKISNFLNKIIYFVKNHPSYVGKCFAFPITLGNL